MPISKRDIFGSQLTPQQVGAGRRMWNRSGAQGRLAKASYSAEDTAAKTWIQYVGPTGEERNVIECEIYVTGRVGNSEEAEITVHGMCPKCSETFLAREDNKTMSVDVVTYRKAPKFLKVHYKWHSENVLNRRVSDTDKIPVVSSPERWMCDYCKEWCVRVSGGIAKDDHKGATIISTPGRSVGSLTDKTTPAEKVYSDSIIEF